MLLLRVGCLFMLFLCFVVFVVLLLCGWRAFLFRVLDVCFVVNVLSFFCACFVLCVVLCVVLFVGVVL